MKRRILSLLLALGLAMGLAAPAMAADTAAIRLSKTTGTVTVSKSSDKPLTMLSNMRLYNGYHVVTSAKSYAWMNLDDSKLIKEDASSEVEVRKSGKKLEVNLSSGNLFFNVTEKLEDDESLNISTSTMIVGIRGTAGYIQMVDRWTALLTVLEGQVQCLVTDPVTGQIKAETVQAGETVTCLVYPQDKPGDKCDILREKWTVDNMPSFVLWDVVRDMDLCDRIKEATGVDIPLELAKEAGGNPSGRVPDGKSATPEVLGEVERRLDADETALQERQDAVDAAVQEQENNHISPDKVFDQEPSESPSGGDMASGGGGGGSSTPTANTVTMPQTWQQIQTLLGQYDNVTVQPSGNTADDALNVNGGMTVPAGKTLAIHNGVDTTVDAGGSLQVDGTLTGQNLTNDGTVVVNSSNTLHAQSLTNNNILTVTSTGRLVVDGTLSFTGAVNLTEGTQVWAKGFTETPPSGWGIADATAEYQGQTYYQLAYSAPIYTVTFDSQGGSAVASQTVNEGELAAEPAAPTREGYYFTGWNTQADGSGDDYTFEMPVTGDITLYAQWQKIYTVTFIAPDGIVEDGTVNPYTATTGTDGKLSKLPMAYYSYKPLADGSGSQVLKGWFTSENGGDQITTSTVFTEDATVYAQWMEGIEVEFYNRYPDLTDDAPLQPDVIQPVAFDSKVIKPADPTRADYTFKGWAKAEDGEVFDFDNTIITEGMESLVLVGMWGPYTITFHMNSGPDTLETSTTTVETNEFGVLAQENWPTDPGEVKIDGITYELVGWSYTDFGYTETPEEIDIPGGYIDYMVFNENKVLYSVWARKEM